MNPEKKKMIVMGVLVLMIVFIGAFQMMGSSPEPAPAKTEKKGTEKTETSTDKPEVEKVVNPDQAIPLGKRDPFAPSDFAVVMNTDPLLAKLNATKSAPVTRLPGTTDGGGEKPIEWTPSKPFTPGGKVGGGDVPPFEPEAPKFKYSVAGIVNGAVKAAVFRDASGGERLVEVGSAIDGASTLVAINGNTVKIKFYDRTLVLNVGGNPSAK